MTRVVVGGDKTKIKTLEGELGIGIFVHCMWFRRRYHQYPRRLEGKCGTRLGPLADAPLLHSRYFLAFHLLSDAFYVLFSYCTPRRRCIGSGVIEPCVMYISCIIWCAGAVSPIYITFRIPPSSTDVGPDPRCHNLN